MTPADLQVIRSTFGIASSDPQGFMVDFRRRALKLDPTLRPALPTIDKPRGDRAFAVLGSVLEGLATSAAAPAAAKDLAERHRLVGLQPRHFSTVGQALLDTLAARTGAAFTDAARSAWADAYVVFAEAMMARCYNQMDLVA